MKLIFTILIFQLLLSCNNANNSQLFKVQNDTVKVHDDTTISPSKTGFRNVLNKKEKHVASAIKEVGLNAKMFCKYKACQQTKKQELQLLILPVMKTTYDHLPSGYSLCAIIGRHELPQYRFTGSFIGSR